MYVCWLACEVVFLWFFVVETKNRTLEETAALFDGDDALHQIVHNATAAAASQDASDVDVHNLDGVMLEKKTV